MNSPVRGFLAWAVLCVAGLLLSACAEGAVIRQIQPASPAQQLDTSSDTQSDAQPVEAIGAGNRLLILGNDGNIYTAAPDGSSPLAYTTDASTTRQYLQPTWSPDGTRIAWSEVQQTGQGSISRVTVSDLAGLDVQSQELPFAPFYLYWSPQGDRLAYLSNWLEANRPTIALGIYPLNGEESATEIDDENQVEPTPTTIARGQPLYFSWHPTDGRLLTHIGEELVAVQDPEGEAEIVSSTHAGFPAPQWTPTGDEIVFATAVGLRRELRIDNITTGDSRRVTLYDERVAFDLSPGGNQLAYALSPATAAGSALGPLYVFNLETGSTRELTTMPVLAFFWSPDSQKLAYLAAEAVRNPDDESDAPQIRLRWYVWDGTSTTGYDTILPSRTFLQSYLTFFDQYARSMTIWSPDSDAFAYAGIDLQNRSGIWVQPLEAEEPTRVAPGVFVAWSPR